MKKIMMELKNDADLIKSDAEAGNSSKAKKLIDAIFDYNSNGCLRTELHLTGCYYSWQTDYKYRKEHSAI